MGHFIKQLVFIANIYTIITLHVEWGVSKKIESISCI